MVKQYSLSKDGEKSLSEHFKVKEFKCKDGSDTILIDSDLIDILEKIRKKFNKPITITSGYRTEAYNKKVSSSTNSQHCKGTAADIQVSGIKPLGIALYADSLNVGGVGYYKQNNFTHVDVRSGSQVRWVQLGDSSTYKTVTDLYSYI
jgi:uncharacterized protein YcbK (DUF882 family)